MIDKAHIDQLDINAIVCIDLADVTASRSFVYQLFKQQYRSSYQPNDRIIFYTNQNIPEQLWRHLYLATEKIDISNFFILICSTQDITEQSKAQAAKWASSGQSFSTLTLTSIDGNQLQENYHIPDSICPLPWTHLEIKNDGAISPCCLYNGVIGNVNTDMLQNVFNGNELDTIRHRMLNGEKLSGCEACWKGESQGVVSNRQRHVSAAQAFFVKHIDSPELVSLDLKPGNTCNFKCRICSPRYSSLLTQEREKYAPLARALPKRNWAEDTDHIFEQIFENINTVENYDLYGGEPFLIKSLTTLVEKIVASGRAPQVRLHYNSNGSIWPEQLLPYWPSFQHIDLHFSIDNTGNRFELERGSTWQQIQDNISQLVKKNLPNLKISIMPTVSIMNVLYLDELFDWAKSLNLDVNPIYLYNPSELSIENLTATAKQLIVNKYKNTDHPELKKVVAAVSQAAGSDGKKFVAYTSNLDKIRQQSFHTTHKEIAEAMGYIV